MKTKTASAEANETLVGITPVLVPLLHLAGHSKIKNRSINKDHVASLAESIAKSGLDTPLVTWGGEKEGSQMKLGESTVPSNFLIAGFHRREALKHFKKENPKAFSEMFPGDLIPVVRKVGPIADMLALNLRENAAREDPEPADILPNLLALRDDHKMKGSEIAARVGKSKAWVSRMFAINDELGKDAADALEKNELGLSEAQRLAEESKKAKKAGKPLSSDEKKAKIDGAKAKTAARRAKGKTRAEKRVGTGSIWGRYLALPKSTTMGRRLQILEQAFQYVTKEVDSLPSELAKDADAE